MAGGARSACESSTVSKLVLVTKDWSGLGLAVLAKSQGSDVIATYDYGDIEEDELEHVELIGDGLIEKAPFAKARDKLLREKNIWLFDNNELPKLADKLRNAGELVIGTSSLSGKMENDRNYAVKVAESVGLQIPQTKKFTDYPAAIKFLESNKDKSYVYKPDEGDATSTYVPQNREDVSKANEELREYISSLEGEPSPRFILQEVVDGVEADFDLWIRNGRPLVAFLDLEAKRKLTGDLGENIGCAGGYVTKMPYEARGVQETVAKYLSWKELEHYTGSIDSNVIITKSGPHFLENCFRFGYAAYPAMFHALAKDSVEDILRHWVSGNGKMDDFFKSGFAASLTMTSDNPKDGQPILIPKDIRSDIDLYRAYAEDGHLRLVEGWPEIACATAHGNTIEVAGNKCLDLAAQVSFPNKGYRLDLATSALPNLPLSRYRALQARGYLR